MDIMGFKWLMARSEPVGLTYTMARILMLGFTYMLARTSIVGFTVGMARRLYMGFTNGMARSVRLGFTRSMARIHSLGFRGLMARILTLGLKCDVAPSLVRPLSPPSFLLPRTRVEGYGGRAPAFLLRMSWEAPDLSGGTTSRTGGSGIASLFFSSP